MYNVVIIKVHSGIIAWSVRTHYRWTNDQSIIIVLLPSLHFFSLSLYLFFYIYLSQFGLATGSIISGCWNYMYKDEKLMRLKHNTYPNPQSLRALMTPTRLTRENSGDHERAYDIKYAERSNVRLCRVPCWISKIEKNKNEDRLVWWLFIDVVLSRGASKYIHLWTAICLGNCFGKWLQPPNNFFLFLLFFKYIDKYINIQKLI